MTDLDTEEYEYNTVQGYVNRGKVKRMLKNGWEVISVTPVIMGGFSLKQAHYFMRRRKTT
jgi:hypothetical protein